MSDPKPVQADSFARALSRLRPVARFATSGEIHLGMSKAQIVEVVGHPTVARGAIRNKFDQVIEVWEYRLALPSSDTAGQIVGKSLLTVFTFGVGAATFRGERRDYWLYFLGDELVQWGEANDWSKEPDRIYEFRFQPSPVLQK